MLPFQGRLLVGVGRLLRIYDIGKKKMLRKCENKHLPNLVVDIKAFGSRVYVSDVQEAVHFVRYKPVENQLVVFADETGQRYSTATCILDYNTVAAADKFGNICIVSAILMIVQRWTDTHGLGLALYMCMYTSCLKHASLRCDSLIE